MKRFLFKYFAIVGAALVFVAGINFSVDPYATFRWSDIARFNDQKTLKRDGGRVSKSLILSRYPFDVIFFGSSTSETGLDPASASLNGARAFNSSLSYTNFFETHKVALFAAAHQTPKLVVIGLDFLSFADKNAVAGDFGVSPFAGASVMPIYLKRLLSQQALIDSVKVVRDSRKRVRSRFPKTGVHDPSGGKPHDVNTRQEFIGSLKSFLTPENYNNFRYAQNYMALVKDIIARFDAEKTEVVFFITPYHALHIDEIAAVGLYPTFELWKRDLTRTIAEANASNGRPAHLWDFSGISSVTTDPVPSESVSPGEHGQMKNYWNANHYTSAVGDLILARILGGAAVPGDFGVELTPQSVDHVLAEGGKMVAARKFDFLTDSDAEIERARQANLNNLSPISAVPKN